MQDQSIKMAGSARREHSGKTGIYYTLGKDGKRTGELEFCYQDSARKTRWQKAKAKTVRGVEGERGDLLNRIRNRGEYVEPNKKKFEELAAEYMAKVQVRDGTRLQYESKLKNHVYPFFGNRRVQEISTKDIVDFIALLRSKKPLRSRQGKTNLTEAYIHDILTLVAQVFHYGTRWGWCHSNPAFKLLRNEWPKPVDKQKRILTEDEVARIAVAIKPTYRSLVLLLAYTGLRLGEALGTKWQDIDLDAKIIRVTQQWDGASQTFKDDLKTPDSKRNVLLVPALASELARHKLASKFTDDDSPVFRGQGRNPMGPASFRQALDKAVVVAGIEGQKPVPHDFRHTFASLCINRGVTVTFLQRQLGHKSPKETLDTYASLYDGAEQEESARNLLDESLGGVMRVVEDSPTTWGNSERDKEIRAKRASGSSTKQLSSEYNLSIFHIRTIVRNNRPSRAMKAI